MQPYRSCASNKMGKVLINKENRTLSNYVVISGEHCIKLLANCVTLTQNASLKRSSVATFLAHLYPNTASKSFCKTGHE